jgi:toxin ParE1/3/4
VAVRVDRSDQALLDLEILAIFLADQSTIEQALRFLDAAERAFSRLARMPQIAPIRFSHDSRLGELRIWPIPGFPNYLIFYRQTQDAVEVVRVLHARRDIGEILGEDS